MTFETVLNNMVIGVIVLIALAGLGWAALKLWKVNQAKEKAINEPVDPQQGAIVQTMNSLAKILEEAEKDSNKASLLLLDAQVHTRNLVSLIQGIALKSEAMAQEIADLNAALAAIASHDILQIAQAAGLVKDSDIRSLMLCKIRNEGYWQDTALLIGAQVGTLTQWERGYRTFTSNLLSEVSQAKAQLAGLDAALELTSASRPLLQVQAGLNEAGNYLQLERRPGLYRATKELPAVNAGLMLR